MLEIPVKFGNDSYGIVIGSDCACEVEQLIKTLHDQKRQVVVITEENVAKAGAGFFKETFNKYNCPIKILKPGEREKSLHTVQDCYEFLIQKGAGRRTVLFAVGGGVVGDLAGFVAATYMRGIEYYQIPTTLLAMVDSAIGGKTGVNLPAGKNLVGAFYQPKGVFIDIDFLQTLPDREFRAGMAEVIKYGMMADDEFFQELEEDKVITGASPKMIAYIEKGCRIKAGIVQQDVYDRNGKRSLLNLGHTFGHAIESATGYSGYLHGQAVSIGLLMAARLSALLGYLDANEVERVRLLLERYALPTRLFSPIQLSLLKQAMHHDKKTDCGIIQFIILKAMGKAAQEGPIDEKRIDKLWYEVGAED